MRKPPPPPPPPPGRGPPPGRPEPPPGPLGRGRPPPGGGGIGLPARLRGGPGGGGIGLPATLRGGAAASGPADAWPAGAADEALLSTDCCSVVSGAGAGASAAGCWTGAGASAAGCWTGAGASGAGCGAGADGAGAGAGTSAAGCWTGAGASGAGCGAGADGAGAGDGAELAGRMVGGGGGIGLAPADDTTLAGGGVVGAGLVAEPFSEAASSEGAPSFFLGGAFLLETTGSDPVSSADGASAWDGSRMSPSRSAFRRTRSACASTMLEEWLLTPIPRSTQRSMTSLLARPNSLASS